MLRLTVLIFNFFLFGSSIAQPLSDDKGDYSYRITSTTEEISIDGILDEPVWDHLQVISDFWLQAPVDDQRAEYKTEVKMFYKSVGIYVGAICYDDPEYVIQTLKRDNFGESDAFGISIDPVNKKTNAYGFAVNALGAQTEVLIAPGDVDGSWDNRWAVETKQYGDRWTIEMFIPFKTLRFDESSIEWGVNFVRIEPGKNETHVWHPVPRQFDFHDLGYYGKIIWDQSPGKSGTNISVIPYSAFRSNKREGQTADSDFEVGGDAKIGLTNSLNLDLTLNPDFSQVEVDRQVTNLTRFNIFFPERRQFFIENNDIFIFGQGANQPFYSRTIGLDGFGRTVPILYGARLTGNISDRTRVGLFNIHSRGSEDIFGQNHTAVAVHHRVGRRSLIKGLFLNRQAYDGSETVENDYGRNGGLEVDLSTEDGKWQLNGGYLLSSKEGVDGNNGHVHGGLSYNGTRFRTFLQFQHVGKDYFTDMGFNARINNFNPTNGSVTRIGYSQIGNMINYYIYPKNSKTVNFHWSGLENFVWINDDGYGLTEWYTRLRHFIFFKNTSQLRFRLNNHYVDLIFPFGITEVPIPAKAYNMTEFNVQYNTDIRRKIQNTMFAVYGQFYEGSKLTINTDISYRAQPWGNFSLGVEYNDINMPEPYGDLSLTLATGRAEINFSTSLFWTTFIQYNTQADNFNVNSRLQWRFAPMSDLFLVFTDNYRIEGMFGSKDRTIALKLNYWLSI
jgi:hypothetical protein